MQRIQVQNTAPTWQLTTVCNCRIQHPYRHACRQNTAAQKIEINKLKKKKKVENADRKCFGSLKSLVNVGACNFLGVLFFPSFKSGDPHTVKSILLTVSTIGLGTHCSSPQRLLTCMRPSTMWLPANKKWMGSSVPSLYAQAVLYKQARTFVWPFLYVLEPVVA